MSFIVKFIQLYSSAETVKKATVLFTASITITIAKAAVSVQIRIATKFLTAVTKKSTVFSLELFNPVIWSFCCFTANCHLLKGTEKEF